MKLRAIERLVDDHLILDQDQLRKEVEFVTRAYVLVLTGLKEIQEEDINIDAMMWATVKTLEHIAEDVGLEVEDVE